jgi:hypothetical protein
MDAHELDEHVERKLEILHREFADTFPEGQIERTCATHLEALRSSATIYDYIPLLVYRLAREELRESRPDELHRSA